MILHSAARNLKWAHVGRVSEEYCALKKQIKLKLPSQANLSKSKQVYENMHHHKAVVYGEDKSSNRGAQ